MSNNIPGLSEVVKRLYELKCCARCVLRYIGRQDGAVLYAKPYEVCVLSSFHDYLYVLIQYYYRITLIQYTLQLLPPCLTGLRTVLLRLRFF